MKGHWIQCYKEEREIKTVSNNSSRSGSPRKFRGASPVVCIALVKSELLKRILIIHSHALVLVCFSTHLPSLDGLLDALLQRTQPRPLPAHFLEQFVSHVHLADLPLLTACLLSSSTTHTEERSGRTGAAPTWGSDGRDEWRTGTGPTPTAPIHRGSGTGPGTTAGRRP